MWKRSDSLTHHFTRFCQILWLHQFQNNKEMSFWKIQQDATSLVWASFVVFQSKTNDQLDKEEQLGI